MPKRKNPSVSDIVSGVVLGSAVSKAKDHVVSYYTKKGKQTTKRKRRNPDSLEMSSQTTHSNDVIPANDVADLVGGEYIPLKGMIVTDDSIQLITNAGNRVSNPGKTKLKNFLGLFGSKKAKTITKSTKRVGSKLKTLSTDDLANFKRVYYNLGWKLGSKFAKATEVNRAYTIQKQSDNKFIPTSKIKVLKSNFIKGYKDGTKGRGE